jgi:predicted secreted acid phosphatase
MSARTSLLSAAAVALALAVSTAPTGTANAADGGGLAPRTHFTMKPDGSSGLTQGGEGIPDVDSVKSTIRTYYKATAGIADKKSSPYVTQVRQILQQQSRYLRQAKKRAHRHHQRPAIVLDADDTTLWTYDMEDGAMHFDFDPKLQDEWVQDERFPATPGMVGFVNRATQMGFKIFGLTGRNDDQEAATIKNLHKVGYRAFNRRTFFTKWTGVGKSRKPAYVHCRTATCTTVEYKAGTRTHIEHLGYRIVLNVGDQWSDLQGGHARKALKLPNPTYFLPSPDLDGTPAGPRFSPRSSFTMKADGSSGLTQGGEGIPDVDVVKSTIRTYYKATAGIADKTSSPYIKEMSSLTAKLRTSLVQSCTQAQAAGKDPAVVFDADDTTLWTYDMEDGAMHFDFDPVVQDQQWVQKQKFPATPGMTAVVNAVDDAGCTVVGLTGRNDTQKAATLGNLSARGYRGFTDPLYFTKWVSGSTPGSARPWMAGTPCADGVCTTIEYKSLTRRHLVQDLGYDVVANVGDQFSDLLGGSGDRTVKLPNPTYYLP